MMQSSRASTAPSTKRKSERLRPRTEKLDLKSSVLNGVLLPDELVEAVFRDLPVALRVRICSVIRPRRLTVNLHPRCRSRAWKRYTIRPGTVRLPSPEKNPGKISAILGLCLSQPGTS
jgi:hypothetical protein